MLYWLSIYDDTALRIFKYLSFRILGAMFTSMIIVLIFTPYIIRFLKEFCGRSRSRLDGLTEEKFIDRNKEKIPSMGGIILVISIVISTVLWASLDNLLVLLFLGNLVAFAILGFYDDYIKIIKPEMRGVSLKVKLLMQFAISLVAVFCLTKIITTSIYCSEFYIPFLKLPIWTTVPLWFFMLFNSTVVVGSSNAVNLTDGLDGLSSSCLIISTLVYVIFAYLSGRIDTSEYLSIPYIVGSGEIAIFGATIVGACIGFLWYNCHPATIFMGDVGSLALGSSVGLIAVMVKQEILLIVIGGVFVFEALSVLIQVSYYKWSGGKRIFLCTPIHYHFQRKGWTEVQIVFRFTIIAIILAFMGLATLKLR